MKKTLHTCWSLSSPISSSLKIGSNCSASKLGSSCWGGEIGGGVGPTSPSPSASGISPSDIDSTSPGENDSNGGGEEAPINIHLTFKSSSYYKIFSFINNKLLRNK